MTGLQLEPCVVGDGFTASYWQDGICLTTNEHYDPSPLVAAAEALEAAGKREWSK